MSTPHQRLYIRVLLGDLEYPTHRTSLQYRIPWQRAGLVPPPPDVDVDPVLERLTIDEAKKITRVLREMTGATTV